MTQEEFFAKRASLYTRFDEELLSLERRCARKNNKVNIGDIVSDGNETIIVDKFRLRRASRYGNGFIPYYDYYGRLLTKKGEPRKDGTSAYVYLERLKTINGKEVSHE